MGAGLYGFYLLKDGMGGDAGWGWRVGVEGGVEGGGEDSIDFIS